MLQLGFRIITILSLLLVPILTQAQIANIEKYRLDKDTSHIWLGNSGFSFSSKRQQNTVTELNAYFNLVYLSDKHSYMTINYTDFQQAGKLNFISEGYTHWRVNFMRRKFVSYEPFVQFQYDRGRGLESRSLYGLSFRFNLLHKNNKDKKDRFDLTFSTGAMYEEEFWKGDVLRYQNPGDSTHAHTPFVKSTSNLFFRAALHEKITLFSSIYYQARYEKFNYPRIIADLQLVFKITKRFSITSGFASTYDSLPIVTRNVFTYKLTSGFLFQLNP